MAPFSQARQILAHARELTLRKRGTQRPPVTLLSLVDGEFPKAPSPLAPRSEAPPPRGASTFWKTHNSATRTRLRPFYLWTGVDPIRVEPRFPRHAVPLTPRRRYTLEAPLNSPRWRLPFLVPAIAFPRRAYAAGEGLRRASQSPSRLRLRCSKARCGLGHLPSQSHIMDTLISFSAAPALAAERNCPWKRLSGARDPGPPANAPGPI